METDLPSIAKQLRALDRKEMIAWLKRGELLTAAKALLQDDASFRTWLRKNGLAKTTAYSAIAAWGNFRTCPDPGRFTKEAMEILAQSDAARDQAIELAKTQKVTAKLARQLVARYTLDEVTATAIGKLSSAATHFEHSIKIDEYEIIIRSPLPVTEADVIGVLSQGLKKLTGYNAPPLPSTAAISPLDRLRNRIAG